MWFSSASELMMILSPSSDEGPVAEGTGGGVPASAGRDLSAPAAGAPEQGSAEGRPLLTLFQPQQLQPQFGFRPALQLLHALLPFDAKSGALE